MSILSDLSRRFHLLTTDAKPDPPKAPIAGYTHNVETAVPNEKTRKKSKLLLFGGKSERESQRNGLLSSVVQDEQSVPNGDFHATTEDSTNPRFTSTPSPANERKDEKKPSSKTKAKSKQYKQSQGPRVISYNIINSSGVKIGSRTNYICNVNQFSANTRADSQQQSKVKFREMPANVESLTNCTEELSLDDMFLIKTHIGHGWRDVARRLSYSEGQIEQFDENYRHRGVEEVVYQLLLDWKQANTKDAQIGHLVKILWACREYDCAERLAIDRNKSV